MTAQDIKAFQWQAGVSGNPAGKPKKPRRSLDAVQRLQALGVDPLEEAVTLAQDTSLLKATRLKVWMGLMEYCYPKIGSVMPSETVSGTLGELQRAWDAIELGEFKEAFRQELDSLPDDVRRELEGLVARTGVGPLVMEMLLKSQAPAQDPQDPEQPGLKVVKM